MVHVFDVRFIVHFMCWQTKKKLTASTTSEGVTINEQEDKAQTQKKKAQTQKKKAASKKRKALTKKKKAANKKNKAATKKVHASALVNICKYQGISYT